MVEELPYKSGSVKLVLWAQTFRVAINRYVQIFESQISVWGHDIESPKHSSHNRVMSPMAIHEGGEH